MSSLKKKADIFHKGFNSSTCKTSLKLAVARLKLLRNKREAQAKVLRREVAQLLGAGQEDSARVKVEHVIREEKAMSAYELIELYCEMIAARLQIIEAQKHCPVDLKEAISSVIFAQARCADLPELKDVRKNLTRKYGKDFADAAAELRPNSGVSSLIVEKLSAKAPSVEVKIKALTAIATENDIDWKPKEPEQQLQTPTKDEGFLAGPSTFQPATKLTTEPAKPESVPQAVQKQESALNTPPQAPSTRGPSSNVPEQKQKETEAVYVQSEELRTSSHQQYWSVNYKDAAAAAEAAAKSAEMANLAAKAAADIAMRESGSRGNALRQQSAEMANLAAKAAADIAMRESGSRGNAPRQQVSVSDEYNQPPSEVSLKSQQSEPINRQPVRTDMRTAYEENSASEGPKVVRDGRNRVPEKEYYEDIKSSGIKPMRNSSTLEDSDELDAMSRNTDGTFHKKSSFDHVTVERYQVNEKMSRNDDDVEYDRTDAHYQYPRGEDKQARRAPRSKPVEEAKNYVQMRDDRKQSTHPEYLSENHQGPGSTKGTPHEEVTNNFEPFQDKGSFRSSAASQFGTNTRNDRSSSQRATSSVPNPDIVDRKKSSSSHVNVEHYQEHEKMARDDDDDDIDYEYDRRTGARYRYSRSEDHMEQRALRGKPVEETKNYMQIKEDRKLGTRFEYSSEDQQGPGSTEGTPYEELEDNLEPLQSEDSFRRRAASQSSTGVHNGRSTRRAASSVPSPDIVDDDANRGARVQEPFVTVASRNSEQAAVRRSLEEEQIDVLHYDEGSYSRTPVKATSSSFKSAFDEGGPSFQDPEYDWHEANTWKEHVASEESADDVLSGFDSARSRKNAYNSDWYQYDERHDSKHVFSSEEVVAQSYMKYEDADVCREDGKGKGSPLASGTIPFEDEVASVRSDRDPNEFISGPGADVRGQTGDRRGSSSRLPEPAFDDGDSDDGHRIDLDNIPSDDEYDLSRNQSGIFLPPAPPVLGVQPESKYIASDISSDAHEKDIASSVFDNYGDSDHDSLGGEIERSPKGHSLKDRSFSTNSARSSSSRVTDGELQLHEKENTPSDTLSPDPSSRGLENRSPSRRKRWNIPTPSNQSTRQYNRDETIVQEHLEEVTAERMETESNTEIPERGKGLSLRTLRGGIRNRLPTPPYFTNSIGEKGLQSEETSDSYRGTENVEAHAKLKAVSNSAVSSRVGFGENVPDSDDLSGSGSFPQHRERGDVGVSHMPKQLSEARKVEQVVYDPPETPMTVGQRSQVDESEEYRTPTLSRRNRRPARNLDQSTLVVEETSATALYESSRSGRSGGDESPPLSRNRGGRGSSESSYDPPNSEEVNPERRRSSAVASRRTKPPATESSRGEFPEKESSDQDTLPRDKRGYGVRSTNLTSDYDKEVDHQRQHPAASGGAQGSRRTSATSTVSAREELPPTENYDRKLLSRGGIETGFGRSTYPAETEGDGEVQNRRWSRASKNELSDQELFDRSSVPRDNYDRGSRSSLLRNVGGTETVVDSQPRPSAAREDKKLTSGRPRVSTEESLRREFSGQEFVDQRRAREESERGYGRSVPSPFPKSDEEINTPPQRSAKLSSRRTSVPEDDHSWKETVEEERYQHPRRAGGRGGEKEASRRTTGLTWESKTRDQEEGLDISDDLDARTTRPHPNSRSSSSAERRSAPIPESTVSGPERENAKSPQRRVSSHTSTELEIKERLRGSAAGQVSTVEVDAKLAETKATEQPLTPPTRDLKQKEPSPAPSADADSSRTGSSGDKDASNEGKTTSHVHPNLPRDYNSFVDNFKRLRANTRK